MNMNPLHEEALINHGKGIGTVSRALIAERAAELAVINGRQSDEATKSDWDEAVRELMGGSEQGPQQEFLESVPESYRWNPVPGSPGHEAVVDFGDGEDEDGRGVEERLVEEGVEEAEHDQMFEATSEEQLRDE